MRLTRRAPLLVAAALALSALGAGCSAGPADPDVLVVYNAQHEDLLKAMTDAFTAQTGIAVETRQGGDSDLANQLVREGADSPADVFVTENSPAMALVDNKGMFAPLEPAVLAAVPPQFTAADKTWAGFAARATALVYNPDRLPEAQLPASLLDLAKPEWKGRFGYAPAGADFQAIVAAVYALVGTERGDAFVRALKDNGTVYASNFAVMQAVDSGQIETGVIYHYYWYKDRAAGGDNSRGTKLHFFGGQDPGAFLSVSGAGVLASSNRSDDARALVEFLTSTAGQQALSASPSLEYSIDSGVAPNPALPALSELDPPVVPIAELDGPAVVERFREVGIL